MRIALLPDDYLPESTLVHAKMFHELAIELKRQGHYPVIITPSHGRQAQRLLVESVDGIEVWRFKNPPMRGKGRLRRVFAETLLSFNAYCAVKNKVSQKPFDACINYSPTIFFGPLVTWLKKTYGIPSYLILRDLFPQWAIDEGLLSPISPATYYLRFFEKLNYRASDYIGLMSEANVAIFSKLHPEFENLQVLRNWAETSPFEAKKQSINVRETFGLHNKVIFFYGGNIGAAQDIGNLLRLAHAMKGYPKAHFLFVGQGDEVKLVLQTKELEQLDNVTYLPPVSQLEYKDILTEVDVGLFSLSKTHRAHNFPGKLLGYMVQSLPILGSVNQGNDLIDFVNNKTAGKAFVNGDDKSLFNATVEMLQNCDLRKEYGQNAYKVLEQFFSVESAAKQIIQTLTVKKC